MVYAPGRLPDVVKHFGLNNALDLYTPALAYLLVWYQKTPISIFKLLKVEKHTNLEPTGTVRDYPLVYLDIEGLDGDG